jgi:hypothetical protein
MASDEERKSFAVLMVVPRSGYTPSAPSHVKLSLKLSGRGSQVVNTTDRPFLVVTLYSQDVGGYQACNNTPILEAVEPSGHSWNGTWQLARSMNDNRMVV